MAYKDKNKQRQANRDHYQRNLTSERKRLGDLRRRYRHRYQEAVRIAKSVPCADCKVSYPYYVMDLDHVRGEKVADINALARVHRGIKGLRALEDEIKKCEAVCANCHRMRSYIRMTQGLVHAAFNSEDDSPQLSLLNE